MEEVTNPVKTSVERQIKANIERTHPFMSKQQFLPHSEFRKVASTIGGHTDYDDRTDGTSGSAAGSTSTNDDFLQTTPGESNNLYFTDEYKIRESNSGTRFLLDILLHF